MMNGYAFRGRFGRSRFGAASLWMVSLVAGISASPALAGKNVTPYIEVQQVLDAELAGGNEVLTYTSVAAGVDAQMSAS